jgi:hypothetical protein
MAHTAKQTNTLISLFEKLYEDKYQVKPKLNRFKHKYGIGDMVDQFGYKEAEEIIEFFFQTTREHSITNLLYNYEELKETIDIRAEDDLRRKEIREETRRRVEGWNSDD